MEREDDGEGQTFLITYEASYKVFGWEKIKVPAGEFNAIKLVPSESYVGQDRGNGTYTYWASPETKCIVKAEFRSSFGHWTTARLLSHKMN